MIDWYKDITANLEYEKEMQERYSDYKLSAKIWQERAERMKVLAAKRKELLRRANQYLSHQDDCALRYNDQVCDCRLSKLRLEIAEELGDD